MSDRLIELSLLSRRELDSIFEESAPPRLDEVVGWDFKGWNCSVLPKIGGFQKFRKGFYRTAETPDGEAEGFNDVVIQNGIDGEWLGLPSDDDPKRMGFYRVAPARGAERSGGREGALLLDYGAHPRNPRLDPSRLLRDVLVHVESEPDLFLGKAHLALGRWVFASYFLLERHRRHAFTP